MTPYSHTLETRLHEGPAMLTALDAASVSSAVCGIRVITGLLQAHEVGTQCEGDAVLRLSNASVGGLLEAVGGLAELIELRLSEGATRAQKAQRQGGMA